MPDAPLSEAGAIIRGYLNSHQHRKAKHRLLLCPLCVRARTWLEAADYPKSMPSGGGS